ncbi:MAG: paraquat-inducible protein B, partial [Pseudomonadota bacterium]
STQMRVVLAQNPDAPRAQLDQVGGKTPVIPVGVATRGAGAASAAEGLLDRVAALPIEGLLDQATATLAAIEDLAEGDDLQQVPAEVNALLAEARALLGNDQTQAIPGATFAAVDDLRAIMEELRNSGSIAALTSVIAQADTAMAAVGEASEDLPRLTANLATLSETAAALEIEALIATATSVLASADQVLGNPDLDDVPAALTASLTELERLLADLTAADVAGSLNATLQSTEAAARALPELVNETEAVLTQISGLTAAYGARSPFLSDSMDVLREITAAARSISQLARAIERNPSSLLTGR